MEILPDGALWSQDDVEETFFFFFLFPFLDYLVLESPHAEGIPPETNRKNISETFRSQKVLQLTYFSKRKRLTIRHLLERLCSVGSHVRR